MAIASMKDMKRRKNSIENIMKITKAMELVALSKLRKSRQRVSQTEPFFNKIYDTMKEISKFAVDAHSDFFIKKNTKKKCYLVIAGDKGLAGNYNGNIFRYSLEQIKNYNKQDVLIISVGRQSTNYFKKKNYNIYLEYNDISENIDINLAFEISQKIINGFLNNQFQEFYIIYTDFVSVLVQKPNIKKVFPISFDSDLVDNKKNYNIIYEPSPKIIFEKIMPLYFTGILYGAIIESFASEQSARRMAMNAANKSAQDMIKDIDIMFNKVRQTNITQEITEISSAANAI